MFKDVPPQILLSGVGLVFALLCAMRARVVLASGEGGGPHSSRSIPPIAWPAAGLAASLAFSAFVWTDAFMRLFESGWGGLIICAAMLSWTGSEVIRAAATGRTTPIIRGDLGPYDRTLQPRRFWASAAWNAAFTAMLAAVTAGMLADQSENGCVDPADRASIEATVAACDRLLAQEGAAPDDRAYWLAGRAFAQVDSDDDRAMADLERALAIDPNSGWALRLRGYIRLKRRDFDGAEADLTRGLALQPDRADAYFDRAMARASTGRMTEAIADAATAMKLDPDGPNYRQLHGELVRANAGATVAR